MHCLVGCSPYLIDALLRKTGRCTSTLSGATPYSCHRSHAKHEQVYTWVQSLEEMTFTAGTWRLLLIDPAGSGGIGTQDVKQGSTLVEVFQGQKSAVFYVVPL